MGKVDGRVRSYERVKGPKRGALKDLGFRSRHFVWKRSLNLSPYSSLFHLLSLLDTSFSFSKVEDNKKKKKNNNTECICYVS